MIIRARDLKKTTWKNGGGTTTEVFRSPSAIDDYDFRLSFAEVASDGPFSEFPGYQRTLVIWSGAGLRLNGEELLPLEVLNFAGELPVEAELIDGPVIDFGCIYRRGRVFCQTEVVRTPPATEGFYFILRGLLHTPQGDAGATDTYIFASGAICRPSANFLAVHVTVKTFREKYVQNVIAAKQDV